MALYQGNVSSLRKELLEQYYLKLIYSRTTKVSKSTYRSVMLQVSYLFCSTLLNGFRRLSACLDIQIRPAQCYPPPF